METTNEVQAAQAVTTQEGIWVPIDQIVVPEDARPHSQEDIDSRAISMDRDGQEQNALLSKEGDKLILVYGHGRLLSAKKNHWEKLRCDIKEGLTEGQKLLMTWAENNEREATTPVYTAQLYSRLMKAEGLDQRGLAAKLGKDESLIGKYLSLNELKPEVLENWKRFQFGIGICLELAKLPKPEDQIQLAQECAEKEYSVRELQARVNQLRKPANPQEKPAKNAGPAFQFHWKGRELQIKVRPFRPDQENWTDYSLALDDAASKYRAAFPLPEAESTPAAPAQEVAQAA